MKCIVASISKVETNVTFLFWIEATISDKNNINQILISYISCETAVRIGPKITETVKGKLSLGARILKVGSVEKIFKRFFSVGEGEKFLKASQCYLSTTAGPIAGLLFISTDTIAFCSERSIKISSPNGKKKRIHYKVYNLQKIISPLSVSLAPWLAAY